MSIFLNKNSKILIQGLTGKQGLQHALLMSQYGSNIVGGVNLKKAGLNIKIHKKRVKVFGTVIEAMHSINANVSIIFVPKIDAKNAIFEAIEANIELIIIITEGIPIKDMIQCCSFIALKNKFNKRNIRIIGPNSPGIISPGQSLAGIIPASLSNQGPLGIISRSGTLTYELMFHLKKIGFSTAIGIGGDAVIGTNYIDALREFENDNQTKLIVLIGEIGGNEEEYAADFIKHNIKKPVIAYIAGIFAPVGKIMGHAGAIVNNSSNQGQAISKINKLKKSGIQVGRSLSETIMFVKTFFKRENE